MKIQYEGEELEFDLSEVTLGQATYLKRHLGLTLMGLDQGLGEGDPDALRGVWWLIQDQSGKKCNIDSVDFKIVKLSNAIQDAVEAERGAEEEAPKDEEGQTQTTSGSSE